VKVDTVDCEDYYGRTPLSLVWESGHEVVVRLLFKAGRVDVGSKDYGGQLQKLEVHPHSSESIAFSNDDRLLKLVLLDGTVRLRNPITRKKVRKTGNHISSVYAVTFFHDSRLITSVSANGKLETHTNWIDIISFSHNGQLLASSLCDKTVRLRNPTTGKRQQEYEKALSPKLASTCIPAHRAARNRALQHAEFGEPYEAIGRFCRTLRGVDLVWGRSNRDANDIAVAFITRLCDLRTCSEAIGRPTPSVSSTN